MFKKFLIYFFILGNFETILLARVPLSEFEKITSSLCEKFHLKNKLTFKYQKSYRYRMSYKRKALFVNPLYCNQASESLILFSLLHEFRHYMQDMHGMLSRRTALNKLYNFYDKKLIIKANKDQSSIWFPNDVISIKYFEYLPKNEHEEKYLEEIKYKIRNYPDERTFKPYEYDAESFAAQNIECPICFDVILANTNQANTDSEGYLGYHDLMKYRKSKQSNKCCKAHSYNDDTKKNNSIKKLCKTLYEPSDIDSDSYQKAICDFDKECGSLKDRYTN